MKALELIIIFLAVVGIWIGGYLVGLGYGEVKVEGILYRVEHLEQRIGNVNVVENSKTSGFTKAMINGG